MSQPFPCLNFGSWINLQARLGGPGALTFRWGSAKERVSRFQISRGWYLCNQENLKRPLQHLKHMHLSTIKFALSLCKSSVVLFYLYSCIQWQIQARSSGGPGPPPCSCFDQTEVRRAKKIFLETTPPPPLISGSGSSTGIYKIFCSSVDDFMIVG